MNAPQVYLGDTRSTVNLAILAANGWGRLFLEAPPTPQPGEPWAFDNGAFGAWRKGHPFPEAKFLSRLDVAYRVPSHPQLAVTPDIVAGGLTSLEFSLHWRKRLKDVDWPWYLAVQDGMMIADVEPIISCFDGVFLGGTDKFKVQAFRWRQLAHKHHLPFHYGRAGTPRKIVSAFKVGSDSLDSAFPLWTTERMRIFQNIWSGLNSQSFLEVGY